MEPTRSNKRKIGGWLKTLGNLIESGQINLTDEQLNKAEILVKDIYNTMKSKEHEDGDNER